MELLTKKLFDENYNNQGDCLGLDKKVCSFIKVFKKENKEQEIKYLPWAVVERIFRGQGGTIDVINHVHEIKTSQKKSIQDLTTGEVITTQAVETNALFIHLRGSWNGLIEDEYYPIFNSQNASVINAPDALDINTAKQRGMVRLIARLSGIGLFLFEQEDKQFDSNNDAAEPVVSKTIIKNKPDILVEKPEEKTPEIKKPAPVKVAKAKVDEVKHEEAIKEIIQEPVVIKTPEPTPEENNAEDVASLFLKAMVEGKSVEPIAVPKPSNTPSGVVESVDDSQELADAILEVRKLIQLTDGQSSAKAFIQSKGKSLIRDLNLDEAKELTALLRNLGKK